MMSAVVVLLSAVIIRKASEQHDVISVFIPKQGDGVIGSLLQIPETDDITIGFYGIEDAIRPKIRLDQPVHSQILVHPQGVQCSGVKAGQEHIDHDQ